MLIRQWCCINSREFINSELVKGVYRGVKKMFEEFGVSLKCLVPTVCECSLYGGIVLWIYPILFCIIARLRLTIETVFI